MSVARPDIHITGRTTVPRLDGTLARSALAATRIGWKGQLLVYLSAYAVYSLARWLFIGDLDSARAAANWILDLERSTQTDIERPVQQALDSAASIWVLNNLYLAAQLVVVPGALVVLYRYSRPVYRGLRNTILATWMLSIPIYALFPVAPPRLADVGLVDTLAGGATSLNSPLATKFFNPLAAVPSLHAGFAFAVAIALAAALAPRWAKGLALLWGPIVCLAVVATGNHFVFDVVAGLVVTAAGYAVGRLPERLGRTAKAPARFGHAVPAPAG